MKSWFAKFRISAAHDANKPLPASLRREVARSEELQRFQENTVALGQALKDSRPENEIQPTFHNSIMRAVRAADRSARPQRQLTGLRWLPAPALAALALLGFWFFFRPSTPPGPGPAEGTQSLTALSTALDAGQQMASALPAAVVAPLSEELERLNRDVENTTQFLLTSVP